MAVQLGEGFEPAASSPDFLRSGEERRHLELLAELAALREQLLEALGNLPVPEPAASLDLTEIVEALESLTPGTVVAPAAVDPEAIGRAVARAIPPQQRLSVDPLVEEIRKLGRKINAYAANSGGAGIPFPRSLSVAPVSDTGQEALPVRVISQLGAGTGGSSGGLTNTELRATPVPVSGTVSTGLTQPLTDTQLRATPVPISGTVSTGLTPLTDTQLRATPVPVSGTVSTGLTQPLTDTQLRASAVPVSGPLTDTQLRATPVPVSGTVTATGPLTDTQIRATPLPVSGTVTDNQGTPNSVANAWPVKNTDGTNTAAVKAASTAAGAADPALAVALSPNSPLPAGTNQLGTTLGPTLTKGTQGGTGYATQDLKDSGRASKSMFSAFTSTAAAETAINFQVSSSGGAPAAAAASYTVTAGKTLRIQMIVAQIRAGGSAPAASLATFKIKVGGNQQGQAFMVAAPTTVAAGPAAFVGMLSGLNFPDGFELAAGAVLSFTLTLLAWTAAVNTPIVDLTVIGYEY